MQLHPGRRDKFLSCPTEPEHSFPLLGRDGLYWDCSFGFLRNRRVLEISAPGQMLINVKWTKWRKWQRIPYKEWPLWRRLARIAQRHQLLKYRSKLTTF